MPTSHLSPNMMKAFNSFRLQQKQWKWKINRNKTVVHIHKFSTDKQGPEDHNLTNLNNHDNQPRNEQNEELWDKWEFGSFPVYAHNIKASSTDDNGWFVKHPKSKSSLQREKAQKKVTKENNKDNNEINEEKKRWKADPLWSFLSDADIDQCNALLLPFVSAERKATFAKILSNRTDNIRFVFECPSNPNNVWAALRTFDSFGLQFIDIILPPLGTTSTVTDSDASDLPAGNEEAAHTPYMTEFRKGSMKAALGSQKWLTIEEHTNTTTCLQSLKDQGYIILASDLHQASLELPKIHWQTLLPKAQQQRCSSDTNQMKQTQQQKFAIVMGNEAVGITNEVRKLADYLFYIPMKGFAESLNLSVACAVTCATLANTGLAAANLTEMMKNRLLFVWLLRTVRGATTILKRNQITALQTQPNAVFNRIGNISTKP